MRRLAPRTPWPWFKSAVSAAKNAYEGVQKAAKQAADLAEANFQALSTSAVRATQAASKGKRVAA